MDANTSQNVIVVTGFGPFGPHKVNDSWECVKKLRELNFEEELGVSLVTHEIPVLYAASESQVPSLWIKHNPKLVIHVGVHNTENIVVERVARKTNYCKPDVSGSCPLSNCCTVGSEESISTCLDLNSIIRSVDSRGIHLSVSENAGSYLCEYTYYLSLCQDPSKTLFIHIPPTGASSTIEDKTFVIKNIIVAAFQQIINQNKNVHVTTSKQSFV